MLFWLRRRRERVEAIEAEAAELIREIGDAAAYSEARLMERDANNFGAMRYWSRVALAVVRQRGKSAGLDNPIGMAIGGDFSTDRKVVAFRRPLTPAEPRP